MDFAAVALEQYAPTAEQANGIAAQLNAAGNVLKLVHEVRENSEDPKLVAFREYRENVLKALADAETEAETHIRDAGLVNVEPVDVEALSKEYATLADQANAVRGTIVKIFGEDAVKEWPNLVKPDGMRKAGAATGTPKPRWQSITVGGKEIFTETVKDGVTTRAVTLTALSQWMTTQLPRGQAVDSSKLRDEVFVAAGTKDISTLNGRPVEMVFTSGDKTWTDIVLTPKVAE